MFEKINLLIPFGNFIRNKSLQNFLFLALIQSSTVLISIISMPLLIQSIGAEQFGWVNLSLSVIIVFNILVGFGFNLSAPREVALNQSNKAELSQLVSNVFSAKLLLALFSTVIILIGAYGLNLFEGYQSVLVFSVFLLFSEAAFPLWFFQGMEKMKLVSVATIFSKLLFLMGLVLFVQEPSQSLWVNFLLGVSGLGVNLCLLGYIHVVLDIRFFSPQFSSILKSLQDNLLLFFSNLASHISINGGLLFKWGHIGYVQLSRTRGHDPKAISCVDHSSHFSQCLQALSSGPARIFLLSQKGVSRHPGNRCVDQHRNLSGRPFDH